MCGIAGVCDLGGATVPDLGPALEVMGRLLAHRGPDDRGTWESADGHVGFAHRRLSIIDLTETGRQPMTGPSGAVIVHNGEVYNHVELRESLRGRWEFRGRSDTEAILAAYDRYGTSCVEHLRGMFAFAVWDGERLFCARDRFGIKPLYYAVVGNRFVFASEVKALLPFVTAVETDPLAFAEYVTFHYTLGDQTLFKGIKRLMPGHALAVENGAVRVWRYWDLSYEVSFDRSGPEIHERLRELMADSLALHLRSDTPVGSYLSGGLDSSLVTLLAARGEGGGGPAFHGSFPSPPGYDEGEFARVAAGAAGVELHAVDIGVDDFTGAIEKVIYHLDYPVGGPGSFPQYMVSALARKHVKVVLGGQGGDEIFGGYARYLMAYFEQCIRAAIDGTYHDGSFVVTAESIIPNLGVLREYTPLLRRFWSEGLFGRLDARYFQLIDRSSDMEGVVRWDELDRGRVEASFGEIFNNRRNVGHEAYFDSMTHFDFKCLLPALLHVEDRMSMAHGLETRVPFLDHPLIEFVATVPADVKFRGGRMKCLIKDAFADVLPGPILERRDKMGFPVPLSEWLAGDLNEYFHDLFSSQRARTRPFLNAATIVDSLEKAEPFSRKVWGLLSLELWYRAFHDQAARFAAMIDEAPRDEGQSQ